MKRVGFFKRLALRYVLKSALTLEASIYGLFESLGKELAGVEPPPSLKIIIQEEAQHQQLLKDIIANRLSHVELARILEVRSFHDLEQVRPLATTGHEGLLDKLKRLQKREAEVLALYSNLYRKSKIPLIKSVFKYLVEQERVHLQMLGRLLGERNA